MSDSTGDKSLLSSSGPLPFMEVKDSHSYCSQASLSQLRNRWLWSHCSPPLWLLILLAICCSHHKLPGSLVLPVCPRGHLTWFSTPLLSLPWAWFQGCLCFSAAQGCTHVESGCSGISSSGLRGIEVAQGFHGATLTFTVRFNRNNLPGDKIHCLFLFNSPRNAERALPPLGPLGFS